MPLAMVIVALLLLAGPQLHWLAYLLIAAWGFFGAVLPIIWSTWITRAADSAGGLYSAALQVAAIVGAAGCRSTLAAAPEAVHAAHG